MRLNEKNGNALDLESARVLAAMLKQGDAMMLLGNPLLEKALQAVAHDGIYRNGRTKEFATGCASLHGAAKVWQMIEPIDAAWVARYGGLAREDASPERLLDDGSWYVQSLAGERRGRLGGYLYARCEQSQRAPGGMVGVGGYHQHGDGQWRAYFDAGGSLRGPLTPVGVFATRNEAVMTLWANRQTAPATHGLRRTTDAEVAQAWEQANAAGQTVGAVVVASLAEGSAFAGKVLAVNSVAVVQSLGRGNAALHARTALSRIPAVGEMVMVNYSEQGRGTVSERERADLGVAVAR